MSSNRYSFFYFCAKFTCYFMEKVTSLKGTKMLEFMLVLAFVAAIVVYYDAIYDFEIARIVIDDVREAYADYKCEKHMKEHAKHLEA